MLKANDTESGNIFCKITDWSSATDSSRGERDNLHEKECVYFARSGKEVRVKNIIHVRYNVSIRKRALDSVKRSDKKPYSSSKVEKVRREKRSAFFAVITMIHFAERGERSRN